jgi:hypothetical protein
VELGDIGADHHLNTIASIVFLPLCICVAAVAVFVLSNSAPAQLNRVLKGETQ